MVFSFEAIGTHWHIEIFDGLSAPAQTALRAAVLARIEEFDAHYSRFRPDSLVSRLSERLGEYRLPEDAQPLFDLYKTLYEYTGGAFTPLIGSVLAEAGYDAAYSFQTKTLKRPFAWEEALQYEFPRLTIKRPVLLDFGAAGKGYLVDLVGGILRENGVDSFVIDAGGDILVQGNEMRRIGLEDPEDPDKVIGMLALTAGSICGSSGNRRRWGAFHHILDPATLASPSEIIATWVVAETALVADALATCLYLVKPETLGFMRHFEYCILLKDRSVHVSKDFPGELFLR